jgi:hypothetical protein
VHFIHYCYGVEYIRIIIEAIVIYCWLSANYLVRLSESFGFIVGGEFISIVSVCTYVDITVQSSSDVVVFLAARYSCRLVVPLYFYGRRCIFRVVGAGTMSLRNSNVCRSVVSGWLLLLVVLLPSLTIPIICYECKHISVVY